MGGAVHLKSLKKVSNQNMTLVRFCKVLDWTPPPLVLPLNLDTNAIIPRGRKKPESCMGHYPADFGFPYRRYHLEKTVHTQTHLWTQGLNLAEQTSWIFWEYSTCIHDPCFWVLIWLMDKNWHEPCKLIANFCNMSLEVNDHPVKKWLKIWMIKHYLIPWFSRV